MSLTIRELLGGYVGHILFMIQILQYLPVVDWNPFATGCSANVFAKIPED